jgi:chorismate synthase
MNSFGRIFRLSIFGESHGNTAGVLLDGVPAGLAIDEKDFREDLDRRKSGAKGTTPRKEADLVRIMSGVFNGYSTGAPILLVFENTNTRSSDYLKLRDIPRPGHADFTAKVKFGGYEDFRGGGHFSGRLTLGLVAAGVIAKKIITPVIAKASLIRAGGMEDIDAAVNMAIERGDSIGGLVQCTVTGVPAGLGEPFFDSVESLLSHIIFSIPAIKGIEFGAGFAATNMKGSEHNDRIVSIDGKTSTNHAGGINGGLTNGNDIVFRIAVKPTSSISVPQETINLKSGELTELKVEGRHDTCIALRVPVVAEAAAAIVMADLLMLDQKVRRIADK